MGIFNQYNKWTNSKPSSTTIISDSTTIKGGIETKGSVFCDGYFEGAMLVGESLNIGISGSVIGEIKTNTLTVSGTIDGIIDAQDVTILATGKVIGKMQYQSLSIEPNGIFEGQGSMKDSKLLSKFNKKNNLKIHELLPNGAQEKRKDS